MNKKFLSAIAFASFAVSACSNTSSDNSERDDTSVASNWQRSEDPIDGPSGYIKFITYDLENSKYPLLISCTKSGLAANITIESEDSTARIALNGTIRLDENSPEPQRFILPHGHPAIWPDDIDDASVNRFISKLEGHNKLAVRLDGLERDFPPVVYDISGIDDVVKTVRNQCMKFL